LYLVAFFIPLFQPFATVFPDKSLFLLRDTSLKNAREKSPRSSGLFRLDLFTTELYHISTGHGSGCSCFLQSDGWLTASDGCYVVQAGAVALPLFLLPITLILPEWAALGPVVDKNHKIVCAKHIGWFKPLELP
jgi:hypothetical protein